MINITENNESYGACNSCLAKDDREVFRVEICPTPHDSTVVRLCLGCLFQFEQKLDDFFEQKC